MTNIKEKIHQAIENDDIDSLNSLISGDFCNKDYGQHLIHKAIKYKDLEVIKYLVKKGGDINCVDRLGRTPLHFTSEYGSFEIIKYLVEIGA